MTVCSYAGSDSGATWIGAAVAAWSRAVDANDPAARIPARTTAGRISQRADPNHAPTRTPRVSSDRQITPMPRPPSAVEPSRSVRRSTPPVIIVTAATSVPHRLRSLRTARAAARRARRSSVRARRSASAHAASASAAAIAAARARSTESVIGTVAGAAPTAGSPGGTSASGLGRQDDGRLRHPVHRGLPTMAGRPGPRDPPRGDRTPASRSAARRRADRRRGPSTPRGARA